MLTTVGDFQKDRVVLRSPVVGAGAYPTPAEAKLFRLDEAASLGGV